MAGASRFNGDLGSRVARADDEHVPSQLRRIPVLRRMKLGDAPVQVGNKRRESRRQVGAGGDHNLVRGNAYVGQETVTVLRQEPHSHAEPDWQPEAPCVRLHVVGDLVFGDGGGRRGWKREPGQSVDASRREQAQGVPSPAPRIADPSTVVDDQTANGSSGEVVPGRQPSLSATDDEDVEVLYGRELNVRSRFRPGTNAARNTTMNWHNRADLSPTLTAVILAAGHGTRMRSRMPKVLHPICGRPMVDWVLDAVHEAGVRDVTVIANPHHAELAAHLDGRVELVYQRDPKGTADALKQVPSGELRGRVVLVVNGDSPLLTAASILKVIHAHQEAGTPATIASVEDPTRDDGRIIRATDGSLEKIVERKDATAEQRTNVHEFNVGVYCFDGSRLVEQLDQINDRNQAGEFYLTDIFLHVKPVTVVRLDDPNEAMGVKDRVRLARATHILRRRLLEGHMLNGVTVVDPDSTFIDAGVTIGQDTVVEPFTVLKGDTHIGADCRVGPHVYIEDARLGDRSDCGPFAKLRPGTEVAEDAHIGSFAELVRTKVGRKSRVPHVAYLGDTDLGEDANIGAGTITANFDGTNKNRTEIGDGAFVGVDTMLVAPVKLGKGARTGAGSVVTKDVPDGATAVGVPARVIRRKT